jgi:hypothetical protein
MSLTKESARMSKIHSRRNRINDLQNLLPVLYEQEMYAMWWEVKEELSDLVFIQTSQKRVHRKAIQQRRNSEGKKAFREWKMKSHNARLARREQSLQTA